MNKKVKEAVETIKKRVKPDAKIGIILGSGLGSLIEEFNDPVHVPFREIPHFPISSVAGHKGEAVVGSLAGVSLLAYSGRVHYYEGYTMQEVVFPIKVMAGLGIETLIITNAAGAVNEAFSPGNIIAINDHISLMGDNPLRGTADFVDMTEAYSRDLRSLAHEVAAAEGIKLQEGVYLVLNGPSYETPAEIRLAKNLGADMVGMSTIPETIMANSLGIKVMGLSMITNMAAGITGEPLTHEEVIETSKKGAEAFKALVRGIVQRLG
ncbi:MAG TPA: purine-nucleoside phosphorylase [Deltaproteobacteria bacterium]|nr:purine-nucleoside phosphorylase [Deltaproteobacteria bacterium]